jgi:hypothetical protein
MVSSFSLSPPVKKRLSRIHPRFHFAHRFLDSGEERSANDTMPDVELVQMRQRADFGDIDVVDPMPCVDRQSEPVGLDRADA